MKNCTKCGTIQPITNFNKSNKTKDGHRSRCRECQKQDMKEYRSNNKEIGKIYYEKNKESILETNKAYREKNKTEIYNKHKEYVEKNKEKIARYKKDYEEQRKANGFIRIRNKEKKREIDKAYSLRHRESIKERQRQWDKTEKGIICKKRNKANRRLREKRGIITPDDTNEFLKNHHTCYWCNKQINKEDSRSYHLDHFVPLSKGGLNVIKNIVLSCAKCNLSKGAMMPEDFAKKIKKVINNDNRI